MTGGLIPDQGLLDELYMHRALELARRGWGRVHPNPLVGAIVVRDGATVGEGWHAEYGGAHAEVAALRQAGDAARGATLYATLEPCNHHGRTPPCTDAVLEAGITRLVYAVPDPNPVARGGADRLRAAGVQVDGGVCEAAGRELNRSFLHVHEHGPPYVLLKLALSLDGCVAVAPGQRTPITGTAAAAAVHRLRAGFDAILIGSGTALIDDPLLTVRGEVVPRVPPARVVLDSGARIPLESRLVATLTEAPLWIVCSESAPADRRARLEAEGARVLQLPTGGGGLDVDAALTALADAGVRTILSEGGARLAGALLRAQRVQRMMLYIAPRLLGASGVRAFDTTPTGGRDDWTFTAAERVGEDVCLTLDRSLPRGATEL